MEMMDKIYDHEDIAPSVSLSSLLKRRKQSKNRKKRRQNLWQGLLMPTAAISLFKAAYFTEGKRAVLLYEEELNAGEIRKFCEYLTETGKDDIYFVLSKKDQDSRTFMPSEALLKISVRSSENGTRRFMEEAAEGAKWCRAPSPAGSPKQKTSSAV